MSLARNVLSRFFPSMSAEADASLPPRSPKLLAARSSSKLSLVSSDSWSPLSSISSSSSSWMPSPASSSYHSYRCFPARWRKRFLSRQAAVVICILLAIYIWLSPPPGSWSHRMHTIGHGRALSASSSEMDAQTAADTTRWFSENSNDRHAVVGRGFLNAFRRVGYSNRPRAALISLVRNSELEGIMQSMRQLEFHWNRKYQYPWIFFNDEPFSDEFKVSHQTG